MTLLTLRCQPLSLVTTFFVVGGAWPLGPFSICDKGPSWAGDREDVTWLCPAVIPCAILGANFASFLVKGWGFLGLCSL